MTIEIKDCRLLREFNLEQAKEGDEILCVITNKTVKYLSCSTDGHTVFIEWSVGGTIFSVLVPASGLRMKPLTWIEGKPVYKGDVLYEKSQYSDGEPLIVRSVFKPLSNKSALQFKSLAWAGDEELTWTKPKEKHIHQELIDAYKAGAAIQYWSCLGEYGYHWKDIIKPCWSTTDKYRIKPPEPEKKSGWINIWKYSKDNKVTPGTSFYKSKEEALSGFGTDEFLVDTVEIHWTE